MIMTDATKSDESRNVEGLTRAEFEKELRIGYQHANVRARERGRNAPINGLTVDQEREIAERVELNYPTAAQCPGCRAFDSGMAEVNFVQGCEGCAQRMRKANGIEGLKMNTNVAQGAKPVAWMVRIGDSDVWSYTQLESDADFYGKQSGLKYEKRPLYTAPTATLENGDGRDAWLLKLYEVLMQQNIVTSEESYLSLRCVGVPPTEAEFATVVQRTIDAALSQKAGEQQ
jgi:hypothetical protein